MNDHKRAKLDHPIHELLASRWSPYGFADRPVSTTICGRCSRPHVGLLLPTTNSHGATS